jgi:N-acetyl-anhydromuramyl-L-alanine amidase AmpD
LAQPVHPVRPVGVVLAAQPQAQARLRDRLKDIFGSIPTVLSPNRSSRRGASVRLAVVHTTESADNSFSAIVDYFRRSSSQVSSHYVVDALAPKGALWARVTQMVPEPEKSWTQRSANPVAVSYELIGRASRTRAEWLGPYRVQLETAAALVAEDTLQYDLPVRIGLPGVVGHVHLDALGFPNNHTDPGSGFPWDVFLDSVRRYRALGQEVEREVVKVKSSGCLPAGIYRIPKPWFSHAAWLLGGKRKARPSSSPRNIPRAWPGFFPWFECRYLGGKH